MRACWSPRRPNYCTSRRTSDLPPHDVTAAARPVLVVDDDDASRDVIGLLLSDEGFPVATAANGLEALARVDENSPSLILLDMRMPVMDGWEFARAYRARPGRHAPIVVITAAPSARDRMKEIQAAGFLAKPFDLSDLIQIVQRFYAA
jgi:CheY-like chemotaxis protein